MRAFEIQEFGLDRPTLVDRPMPEPPAGAVLVKMHAASLNYRDLMVAKGLYNPKMRRPVVPLSDGSGVVEKVGANVTRWQVGDRVTGIFMQSWVDGAVDRDKANSALGGALDGVLAEYVVFPEHGLVPSPAHLSDQQAATLPCAAVTAWHALFEQQPPVPGQTVLLLGTGGVSIFALQMAHAAGLRTIITSSSDTKLARARTLGAHETVNYKHHSEWDAEARRLTGGQGVDHVIEVGGSGTLGRSLRAVKPGGTVSVIGVLSGADPNLDPRLILMNSLRLQGIYVGSRAMFERMNRALTLHAVQPVIDRVFPWTEFLSALRHLESGAHFGKIVLEF